MGERKNKTFEERCYEVYEFFMIYYGKNHVAPSYTDMTKGTGVKQRGNLAPIIARLIADGKLERKNKTSRGLWPARSVIEGAIPIQLKGHIAADNIKLAVVFDPFDSETTLEVPMHLLPIGATPKNHYALKVVGDSMSRAHIMDGDYVVMQSGNTYRDDDIVSVLIKDENAVTLKILKQTRRGNVKLQPKSQNPKHQPRFEKAENIEVQGRVVAVLRKC
jgi:repressor LexA